MNKRAHLLSAFAVLAHLIIGIADPLNLPYSQFLPPSWQVMYRLLPNGFDWVYPALWIMTGLVALAGVRWPTALRWGFRMSSLLYLSWGLAGIVAMVLELGGNIQGSTANLYIAGTVWVVSYYVGVGERADKIDVEVVKLAEQKREIDGNPI